MSTYSFIFRGRTCIVDVTMSGPTVSENSSMPNNELGDALRVLINEEVREVDRRQRVLAEWGMTREEVARRQAELSGESVSGRASPWRTDDEGVVPEPEGSPGPAVDLAEVTFDYQRGVSTDAWIVRRGPAVVGIIVYCPGTADAYAYAFAWLTPGGHFLSDAEPTLSKAQQTILDYEGVDDAPAT